MLRLRFHGSRAFRWAANAEMITVLLPSEVLVEDTCASKDVQQHMILFHSDLFQHATCLKVASAAPKGMKLVMSSQHLLAGHQNG